MWPCAVSCEYLGYGDTLAWCWRAQQVPQSSLALMTSREIVGAATAFQRPPSNPLPRPRPCSVQLRVDGAGQLSHQACVLPPHPLLSESGHSVDSGVCGYSKILEVRGTA